MVEGMDKGRSRSEQGRISGGERLGKRSLLRHLCEQRTLCPLGFRIGESAQRLVIDAAVLKHFMKHQQHDDASPEAGGQLFARLSEKEVTVSRITGPRL